MNMTLARHLWRSPSVRAALWEQALYAVGCLVLGFGLSLWVLSQSRGTSRGDWIEMLVGLTLFFTLFWLALVGSTIRVVLRESAQPISDEISLAAGDARCWREPDSSVMLKAATVSGEPLKLTREEAVTLGQALLQAADRRKHMNKFLARYLAPSGDACADLGKYTIYLVGGLVLLVGYSFWSFYPRRSLGDSIESVLSGTWPLGLVWLSFLASAVQAMWRERTQPGRDEVSVAGGDARCWIVRESSVSLKAATVSGDPIELTQEEASTLGQTLLQAAARMA